MRFEKVKVRTELSPEISFNFLCLLSLNYSELKFILSDRKKKVILDSMVGTHCGTAV